jgi:3-oxoacyl-[acyl-carrier-protein] synthase II
MLVLEDLAHARRRSAKIYAVVEGYGFAFDPKSRCVCNPRAEGAILAIKKALKESNMREDEIDSIFGSANSTIDCDKMEARAIKEVFKKSADNIALTSVKSMLGEAFTAGAVFATAAAAIATDEGFMPPTINYKIPDKRCELNIIKNRSIKLKSRKTLVNSFSPTGTNSTLILSGL